MERSELRDLEKLRQGQCDLQEEFEHWYSNKLGMKGEKSIREHWYSNKLGMKGEKTIRAHGCSNKLGMRG